jgi:hypothetical protein
MHMHSIDAGFSRHAKVRMQQRAIPQAVIDYLLSFGESKFMGSGYESYFFTKRTWKRFEAYLGTGAVAFERYRAVYVIAADGQVVTAAFKH